MNIGPVRAGDIVLVDIKGRIFLAQVEDKSPGELKIKPIDNRVTYRRATSHQVKDLWVRNRPKQIKARSG